MPTFCLVNVVYEVIANRKYPRPTKMGLGLDITCSAIRELYEHAHSRVRTFSFV